MKMLSMCKVLFVTFLLMFGAQTYAKSNMPVTDSVITSKIKGKIALDQSLSNFNVGVSTQNGVVTLDGMVDSDSQAEGLFEIAENTNGVKDINAEHLTVKNSQHLLKDTFTTAKVKSRLIQKHLFQDDRIPLADVHVETNNGVVYLTGTAKSQSQINRAIAVAKTVSGVKRVESRLQVTQ